jgi:hypothetical protein
MKSNATPRVVAKTPQRVLSRVFASAIFSCATAFSAVLTKDNVEVVVSPDASPIVKFAAVETTNFLSKVFSSAIPVRHSPGGSGVSIILGDNEWARAEGIDVSSFVQDEFVIKAVGNRVYIAGRDDPKKDPKRLLHAGGWGSVLYERATTFGVYEFLDRFAGVRFYFPGELGTIVPMRESVEVNGEVSVRPDFESRFLQMWSGEYFEPDPKNFSKTLNYYRLRFETFRIPACHGSRLFMYQRRFGKTNPEYFCLLPNGQRDNDENMSYQGVQSGQLCWSSGIVEEMYKDARSYLLGEKPDGRKVYSRWGKKGEYAWNSNCSRGKYVDIMPQDGMIECGCEKCRASIALARSKGLSPETYLVWSAVSNVATRLSAEGLDGIVSMMAYNGFESVPDFALPPNIAVMLATKGPWSVNDKKSFDSGNKIAAEWSAKLGRKVRLWNYVNKVLGLDVKGAGVPQNCPRAWAKFYKHSAKWINGAFAQSESDRWLYNYLNYYVFSKVCWDNDVDVDALLSEHYRLMFGAAAGDMAKIYETLEECWICGVVGKNVETPLGPVVKSPSEKQMWEEIYSPEKIAGFEELLKSARSKVSPGSLEAKRIDLIEREFIVSLRRRSAGYAKTREGLENLKLELSVGDEKKVSLEPFAHRTKGRTKKVGTDVYVRRTKDALVVRYVCEEPCIEKAVARKGVVDDPDLWQENVVEFIIDPLGDYSSYCQFIVNSEGSWSDSNISRLHLPAKGYGWNSGMEVKVEKGKSSWTAELRIPLSAFPGLPKEFSVEFARERAVSGDSDCIQLYHWSPYAYGFLDLENQGRLIFK